MRWPALTLVLVLAWCAPPRPVSLARGDRHYARNDYDHVYRDWTRHASLLTLNGFFDNLKVDATYLSWDFRHAYVSRFAADATLTDPERQQALAASLDRAQTEHEFYVALETPNFRQGQLNREYTAWRVRLVDDQGRAVAPARIEPVHRVSAADHAYFPYTTPFRQVYRIHFPRRIAATGAPEYEVLGPGTRYFVLRFAGALGTADLRWDVTGPG